MSVCRISFLLNSVIPKHLREHICWSNLTTDQKKSINQRKSTLAHFLPVGAFDAIFALKNSSPASLQEYMLLLKFVEEVQEISPISIENLQKIVDLIPVAFNNILQYDNIDNKDCVAMLEEINKSCSDMNLSNVVFDEYTGKMLSLSQAKLLYSAQFMLLAEEIGSKNSGAIKLHDLADEFLRSVLEERLKGIQFSSTKYLIQAELQRLVECFCCGNRLHDPKTLPCLHTYCKTCLKDLYSAPELETPSAFTTILCKLCKTRFSLNKSVHDSIQDFPVNPPITAFLNLLDLCNLSDSKVTCFLCFLPPRKLCIQCKQVYCSFHGALCFHQNDDLDHANHTVILLEDILLEPLRQQNILYGRCLFHQEPFAYFCETCQISFCENHECRNQHLDHPTQPAAELVKKKRIEIQSLNEKLNQKLRKLQDKVRDFEIGESKTTDMEGIILQSVNQYFDNIAKMVEMKRDEFLAGLKSVSKEFLDDSSRHQESLKNWILTSQIVLNKYGDSFLGKDNENKNINEYMAAKHQCSSLIKNCLRGATLAQPKITSYPEGKLRGMLQKVNSIQPEFGVINLGGKWETVVRSSGIKSFCIVGDKLYLIKDTPTTSQILSCNILARNCEDQVLHVVCQSSMPRFLSVAHAGGNLLAIAEEAQNILDLTNLRFQRSTHLKLRSIKTGEDLQRIPLNGLDRLPGTLTVKCSDNSIYISDTRLLCEYSMELDLKRRLDFHNLIDVADFEPESEMNDCLWVTDKSKHSVLMLNREQTIIKTIPGGDSALDMFFLPLGITVDAFGHVIIADAGNKRIQIFDQSGDFMKLLGYPPVFGCEKLAFEKPSKAIVSVQNDFLYLFDDRCDVIYRVRYI